MEEQEDRELSEEEFTEMVDKLVASFSLLRWRWLGGPGDFPTRLDFHFNFHDKVPFQTDLLMTMSSSHSDWT